jgi:hypothetical protein
MSSDIPIVSFDTSAHNRLVKDGACSEAVMAGIKSRFFFRFAALSIEELVATPDVALREAFFDSCARLQEGPNDCLWPQNELMRLLTAAHFQNPATFDWTTVDVRATAYEDALRRRDFVKDQELATAQGQDFKYRKTSYKQTFSKPRLHIQEIFAKHGEKPPATLRESISRLQSADTALIWTMGKWIYDRGADADANEATVKQFMDACPSFRALVYAMLMSWYNFSVRDPNFGEKFSAGANDQFMSVYLPYCHKFVTAETNGEQEKCLREIVFLASLQTEILSYDDFRNSLMVTA